MLSIIIPVFNYPKIESLVRQLVIQSLTAAEIIIVDDGSTDETVQICEELKENFNNVKVIHKSNGGASDARNFGMKNATKSWIWFVDADDIICDDAVKSIVNVLKKTADLHVFSFNVNNANGLDTVRFSDLQYSSENLGHYLVHDVLNARYGNGFLWNKLYRRDIITANNLRFDTEMRIQEDEIFNLNYLRKCRSIELHSQIIYNYNIATPSNSRTRYLENYFECIEKVHNCFELVFNEFHVPVPLSLYTRTLHAVMVNELMFYFLHHDNQLSYNERRNHLKMIGDADVYKHSVSRIKKSGRMPVEWRCYHQAVKMGSMNIFMFWHAVFAALRHIKHTLYR